MKATMSHPRACADESVSGAILALDRRVIPARARTKASGLAPVLRLLCHPRACADESSKEKARRIVKESSPRVRGRKSHGDQPKRKLRYPSHDTLGCFSSSRLYLLVLNRLRGRSVC